MELTLCNYSCNYFQSNPIYILPRYLNVTDGRTDTDGRLTVAIPRNAHSASGGKNQQHHKYKVLTSSVDLYFVVLNGFHHTSRPRSRYSCNVSVSSMDKMPNVSVSYRSRPERSRAHPWLMYPWTMYSTNIFLCLYVLIPVYLLFIVFLFPLPSQIYGKHWNTARAEI